MNAIGVIPARWQSTRFPGKVLADIAGKPMIRHVWERCQRCRRLDDLWIACDDRRVFDAARAFGAKAVMTSPDHPSGSDRIAEAVRDLDAAIVVNIQGDEPLIDPQMIDGLVDALEADPASPVATVITGIVHHKDLNDPNVVKVVVDANGNALYFSRSLIPFNRNAALPEGVRYFKHLGLYAYRKEFLLKYTRWPKSRLEQAEQLEQLRVLEAGHKIKTIETTTETIAVDTPEDLKRLAAWFQKHHAHD